MSILPRPAPPVQRDVFREMLDAWDIEHRPTTPVHPDSIEWDHYASAREAFELSDGPDGPTSDVEWLEELACELESRGLDAARMAGATVRCLVAEMTRLGVWAAADLDAARARADDVA